MKRGYITIMNKLIFCLFSVLTFLISGCSQEKNQQTIVFAVSSEYPPFEYKENGQLVGFDIDLARLIAKSLHKKAVFLDMQFSAILPTIVTQQADAAISTITVTGERRRNVDFSDLYYKDGLALIYSKQAPLTKETAFNGTKMAYQLGSTMEVWLKTHAPGASLSAFDSNHQAVAALKAGHVQGVLMDAMQVGVFCEKNPGLAGIYIATSEDGYAIALPKQSPLRADINKALANLKAKGLIKQLETKWALSQ